MTFDPGPLSDLQAPRNCLRDPGRTLDRRRAGGDPNGRRHRPHVGDPRRHTASGRLRRHDVAPRRRPVEPATEAVVVYSRQLAGNGVGLRGRQLGPVPVEGLRDLAGPGRDPRDRPDRPGDARPRADHQLLFVERSYPTGCGGTRTSSWAVPAVELGVERGADGTPRSRAGDVGRRRRRRNRAPAADTRRAHPDPSPDPVAARSRRVPG